MHEIIKTVWKIVEYDLSMISTLCEKSSPIETENLNALKSKNPSLPKNSGLRVYKKI